MHPLLLAAIVITGTWDSWRWTLHRLTQNPDEGLSLLLTFALLAGLAIPHIKQRRLLSSVTPLPAAVMLALHAALTVAGAPSILRSALATIMLAHIAYRTAVGHHPPVAFWGLVALSMPVLPSLQFVFGYPMRLVSAALTVTLLRLQGVPITRDGTYVTVAGETVQFDAPCSGIAMLWALVLVTLMAAVIVRLDALRTGLALALAVMVTILANALRVASLLYATSGLGVGEPAWLHEAVGLAAFVMSACLIAACLRVPFFLAPQRCAA